MNTPAQCGVIKPPKTDIYSEAPHLIAAPCHSQITSTATIHLGDAPSSGSDTCRDTRIIPHRRGFSADAHPHAARTRERSGLVNEMRSEIVAIQVGHEGRKLSA